jgi:hypothetical protein
MSSQLAAHVPTMHFVQDAFLSQDILGRDTFLTGLLLNDSTAGRVPQKSDANFSGGQ